MNAGSTGYLLKDLSTVCSEECNNTDNNYFTCASDACTDPNCIAEYCKDTIEALPDASETVINFCAYNSSSGIAFDTSTAICSTYSVPTEIQKVGVLYYFADLAACC